MQHRLRQSGFTLLEMIMVIVIMGVIGGTVAMFMTKPVGAYFDTGRRATMTDIADTAVRRMSRDIGRALPNSIRNANSQCIEFIPTRTGARYRAAADAGVAGDQSAAVLDFTVADTSFNMLARNSGWPGNQQIQVNDLVAIYNLGIAGADAYAGDNTAVVSGVVSGAETTITIAAKQFPLTSGNNRFQVIPGDEKIVAYVCSSGSLLRSSNYAYTNSCPTTASIATVAVLATNVAACNFVASASDQQRNALVQLTLTLTDASSESVSLYHEVHVSNTP